MWIISKGSFVSLVQHQDDSTKLRARARTRAHLIKIFPDATIEDLGVNAPDYRWHANVDRADAAAKVAQTVMDVDYTSHVKEAVTGGHGPGADHQFYSAMMQCWRALNTLQDRGRPAANYGYGGSRGGSQGALWPRDDYALWPDLDTEPEPGARITKLSDSIAARMTGDFRHQQDLANEEYEIQWDGDPDAGDEVITSTDGRYTLMYVSKATDDTDDWGEWRILCVDESAVLEGFEDIEDAEHFVEQYEAGEVEWV
jgi:hypothetical protein